MDRDEFIRLYVIQFCASYVASHFDENCSHNLHERSRNPPVEDAIHLAECAWEKVLEHGAKYFQEQNDPRIMS